MCGAVGVWFSWCVGVWFNRCVGVWGGGWMSRGVVVCVSMVQ